MAWMRVGLLSSENWIGNLPEAVRADIFARSTLLRAEAGEEFSIAGQMPRGMFQVVEGFLRLTGLQEDGGQTLITIYSAGNAFAETAVVARRPLNHTTQAMTPVTIRCLARADFWELYGRHPEIPDALCRKFAAAIGRQIASRQLGASTRLGKRIGMIFEELAHRAGRPLQDGRIAIDLPVTQQDLADHLGVTRQSIQREIRDLKAARLIGREQRQWYVRDLPGLERLT
ncbi:Crp/Fnr family transcriptional regulator [Phenylobacterium sp. VNQ135]|uniref:Crp/Fnr family transcriptional regulator n=1 Tax=Phenylobacterium sp. VNQ135 TaxID=3400922 RepID=UPI003C0BDBD1